MNQNKNQSIPGVVMSSAFAHVNPMLLLVGPEKSGKSAMVGSLIGWNGGNPLVIAIDPTGPSTCATLGWPVHILDPENVQAPTPFYKDKMAATLDILEHHFGGRVKPFSSLVIDDASSLFARLMLEDPRTQAKEVKDKRQSYLRVRDFGVEMIERVNRLGVPTVWITWLNEPFVQEQDPQSGAKVKRQVLGGPMVEGQKLRALLCGKAHSVLVLEKKKVMPGTPGVSSDGFLRLFHTRTWEFIEGSSRAPLPEPCPAHLGYVLDIILGRTQAMAQPQQTQMQMQSQTQQGR